MTKVALIGLLFLCSSASVASSAFAWLFTNNDSSTGGDGGDDASTLEGGGSDYNYEDGVPVGQYVTFAFPSGTPERYVLTPREIRVFDENDENVALTKTVEVSGEDPDLPGSHAVDGDTDTLWHSQYHPRQDFIKIDLGEEKKIHRVEIVNVVSDVPFHGVNLNARMSGGGPDSEIDGAYIMITSKHGVEVVKTDSIKTVAENYTYDFTDDEPAWK